MNSKYNSVCKYISYLPKTSGRKLSELRKVADVFFKNAFRGKFTRTSIWSPLVTVASQWRTAENIRGEFVRVNGLDSSSRSIE